MITSAANLKTGVTLESEAYQSFLLAALSKRPEVKGAWFNAKEFKIDGYKFTGCRFDNCKLHVSSVNFEFENCFIDPHTAIIYNGEIVKIIRLFNSRNSWIYQAAPSFAPVRNPDGTITISA
jgi:hypothetical protein